MRSAPNMLKTLNNDDAWRLRVEASLWVQSSDVMEWVNLMNLGPTRTDSFCKVLKYAYEQGAASGKTRYWLIPNLGLTVKFRLTSYIVMLIYKWKENWRINHAECYDP
jgi:hypothetical protein